MGSSWRLGISISFRFSRARKRLLSTVLSPSRSSWRGKDPPPESPSSAALPRRSRVRSVASSRLHQQCQAGTLPPSRENANRIDEPSVRVADMVPGGPVGPWARASSLGGKSLAVRQRGLRAAASTGAASFMVDPLPCGILLPVACTLMARVADRRVIGTLAMARWFLRRS